MAAALGLFAALNLCFTMTPVARDNALLDARFEKAQALPDKLRRAVFDELRDIQERNLAQRPSDPYGWSRLSYLRFVTLNDSKAGFDALFMSDFVSPYEAPQLSERAVMWYRYRDIENNEQQSYQDILWQKAYGVESDSTWKLAVQNNLVHEAGESLKKTNPAFYGEWKNRESNQH